MIVTILSLAALMNGVDPNLLVSLCTVETRLQNVINHQDGGSKSYGICQIKLATARIFYPRITTRELMNPKINADIAAKYLKKNLVRYHGHVDCAVAAYNAGRCIRNTKGVIRNIKYVNKVHRA